MQAVTEHTVLPTVLGSCECEKVCRQRIPLARISELVERSPPPSCSVQRIALALKNCVAALG